MPDKLADVMRIAMPLRETFGSFIDETIAMVARSRPGTISFAVGAPAPEAIELANVADLAEEVLRREGPAALGYGITEGDSELREIIASTASADGVRARPDEVIVTTGALQAIDLIARVLVGPGDVVVVESPGYTNALSAFRNQNAHLVEVPTDQDGIDVDLARQILTERGLRPRLFYVVPNFQNPRGATLSADRRRQLLELASRFGALIVEDDPYRKLRFRGEDLMPMASLARERVISVGSFSKTFVPGVRVGWAIADREIVAAMASAKQATDSCTTSLGQRLLVAFHRRRDVAAHLTRLRTIYRDRGQAAVSALGDVFGDVRECRWSEPWGGFYIWVELPADCSARAMFDQALAHGVAFVPGEAFAVQRRFANAFRLSYSYPSPDRIGEGGRRLRLAFNAACG